MRQLDCDVLQLALPKAAGDRPRPGVPPLSAGIPALFGRRCLDLMLNPPTAPQATFCTGNLKMAHFPAEPDHLVGRSMVMGAAARLLTVDSKSGDGQTGIMFTGPAGIGKTACAVELAYLPVLTELMERNAILIVIDGIDGLLTSDGYWRDPSWGKAVEAVLVIAVTPAWC